jgi:signal transduction histidine kinase
VRGVRQSDGVLVSVTDEGRGIPVELHDKVFERFYQVDQSSTRAVGGTGLGLYICRKMTDVIGGRLWLERSDRMGSTFCLWIPTTPPLARKNSSGFVARGVDQRKVPVSDSLRDVTSQRGANPDA